MALSTLSPELVAALLEQGGPTLAAVAILWWRLNQLEDRFSSRLEDLEDDIDATESMVLEEIVASGDVQEDVDEPTAHPLDDRHLQPEEHRTRGRSSGD